MHWRNPSTWQPGEKHDSWPNLEVILLYIFLRFWWHWIISYVTNLLGSIFLMPMQRNAQGWYYYSFYHLQYLWWSLPVRIQINKEKQIQTTHSWSYQCFKNKDFSVYQKKQCGRKVGKKTLRSLKLCLCVSLEGSCIFIVEKPNCIFIFHRGTKRRIFSWGRSHCPHTRCGKGNLHCCSDRRLQGRSLRRKQRLHSSLHRFSLTPLTRIIDVRIIRYRYRRAGSGYKMTFLPFSDWFFV